MILGEKSPDSVDLFVKFFVQNVVLRIYRRKNSKMFPCKTFLRFWQNVYQSALVPQNFPCPEKFLVAHLYSSIILAIFWALAYLELEVYSKPCETLTRHIQIPGTVKTVYSGIIQPYSGIFRTLCNVCICRNLAYLEFWNIQIPSIIAS